MSAKISGMRRRAEATAIHQGAVPAVNDISGVTLSLPSVNRSRCARPLRWKNDARQADDDSDGGVSKASFHVGFRIPRSTNMPQVMFPVPVKKATPLFYPPVFFRAPICDPLPNSDGVLPLQHQRENQHLD